MFARVFGIFCCFCFYCCCCCCYLLLLLLASAAAAYAAAAAAAATATATALLLIGPARCFFSLPTLLRKLNDGCCTELSEKFRVRILLL